MKKKTTKAATKRGVVSVIGCSAKKSGRMTVNFTAEVSKKLEELAKLEGKTKTEILKRALGLRDGYRCPSCGHIEYAPDAAGDRVLRKLKWL